ncbi:proprotein convertase P-domain-containing protein [Streptomyces sp. NPDC000880]
MDPCRVGPQAHAGRATGNGRRRVARRGRPFSSSDSADHVQATYTVNASSEVANGTWKLRVQDKAAQDVGYINSFKLTF